MGRSRVTAKRRARHGVPEIVAYPDDAYTQAGLPDATTTVIMNREESLHELMVASRRVANFLSAFARHYSIPDGSRAEMISLLRRLDAALDRV